jgi:cytochrome c553
MSSAVLLRQPGTSRRLITYRVLMLLAGASATAAQAQTGDPAAGEVKAAQCAGCHGIPGWRNAYPAYQVPKLGGQHAEYLAGALKAYRTKQRAHPGMQGIAASLSDQDIADLSAFLAATPQERRQ